MFCVVTSSLNGNKEAQDQIDMENVRNIYEEKKNVTEIEIKIKINTPLEICRNKKNISMCREEN